MSCTPSFKLIVGIAIATTLVGILLFSNESVHPMFTSIGMFFTGAGLAALAVSAMLEYYILTGCLPRVACIDIPAAATKDA